MISYLCTSPLPKLKKTDAVYNEINFLAEQTQGTINSLFPFDTPNSKFPIPLYGLHNLLTIKKLEKQHKINHIFGSGLFRLPFVYFLKKPCIYSVVASIHHQRQFPSLSYLKKFAAIIISNGRDYQRLENLGLNNVKLVQTGIDISKIEPHTTPLKSPLHLLLASAPWEKRQFETKGIHLLLKMLQQTQDVYITFLWRGILSDHMKTLIEQYGVSQKCSLIDEVVDINDYMQKIHGTILLTSDASNVKALPHSLIESLVSQKPVILSKKIPMADFVQKTKVGIIINNLEEKELITGLKILKQDYETLVANVKNIAPSFFSIKRVYQDYQKIYAAILDC